MTTPELLTSLARLETKMDMVLDSIQDAREARKELANRVTALETWRSWLAGAWAVAASFLAFLGIKGS
jgi:hypothetical protein